MAEISAGITKWLKTARAKVKRGGVKYADLDRLEALLTKGGAKQRGNPRQRLLYLTCNGMHTHSAVIACDAREPLREPAPTRLTEKPEFPYNTVHEAILDGWRIVVFPDQNASIDDRELNVFGYQFILEKLEVFRD